MTEFTKTQPAGRMIARLFAQVGWGIVALGVALALLAALLGRLPGVGEAGGNISLLSRLLAALPGLGLALFGLFSVMMAAQTRAAIDSADIGREMLVLARRRPISLLAAVPPLGEDDPLPRRPASPRSTPAAEHAAATPAARVPDADPSRTRFGVRPPAVSVAPPMPPLRAESAPEPGKDPRAEPVFAASARPRPAAGKVHPIFSARPPR